MKILVALDNSDPAFKALEKALGMAKKEKADLTLMTVYPDFPEDEGGLKQATASLMQVAEKTIAKGKSEAEKAGVAIKTVIEAGYSAAENIVKHAGKNNIDMIVMGHKSKTGMERLLIGSVAGKVVTYAPCSVLVVR
ncbi:MAG: universal stress protein [Deltaproteobacteria bacterium]|nr:universal stress protein [Deltaproteobacteria bacterium]